MIIRQKMKIWNILKVILVTLLYPSAKEWLTKWGRKWVELTYCQIRLDQWPDVADKQQVTELIRAVNYFPGNLGRS